MNISVEKQLLNEMIKREKELQTLKKAYEVLTGSELVGIGTILVDIPFVPVGDGRKSKKGNKVNKSRNGKRKVKKTIKGSLEHRKKMSRAMKKAWKIRKRMNDTGLTEKEQVDSVVKRYHESKITGKKSFKELSDKEKGDIISKRMKAYWAKRREEKMKLAHRGLPKVVESINIPREETPIIDSSLERKEKNDGRLASIPVGRVRKARAWTPEENEVLRILRGKETVSEIAKRLFRSEKSVQRRIEKMKEDKMVSDIFGSRKGSSKVKRGRGRPFGSKNKVR